MTKLKIATLTCLLVALGCFFSLFMPIQNHWVVISALFISLLLAHLFNVMNTKIETGWAEDVFAVLRKNFGLGLLVLTVGVLGFWGFEAIFNFINKTNSQVLSVNTALFIGVVDLLICYIISLNNIIALRNYSRC